MSLISVNAEGGRTKVGSGCKIDTETRPDGHGTATRIAFFFQGTLLFDHLRKEAVWMCLLANLSVILAVLLFRLAKETNL